MLLQLFRVFDIEESLRRPYSLCVSSLIFSPQRRLKISSSVKVQGRVHIVLHVYAYAIHFPQCAQYLPRQFLNLKKKS